MFSRLTFKNSGTQTGINVMLFDSGWNPLFSSDKIGHVQTTFTFKKPDRVRIRAFQNPPTYALTSGGGFRASSPRRTRRTSPVKAGGR